jgi:general secretion pathway protein G
VKRRQLPLFASRHATAPAFTLVELVLVIVIIGVLAAIAIPRFSRGSTAAAEAALAADLRLLRTAIMTYALEHNGAFPGPDAAGFANQLTRYTSEAGANSPTRSTTFRFGPYLQAIPPCPSGENAGKPTANAVLISATSPPAPNPHGGEGWVYNPTTGEILPNTNSEEAQGEVFSEAPAVGGSGSVPSGH